MKTINLLLLLAMSAAADARAETARNAAYFELGGSAVVPSINYERRLTDRWFGRIGASVVTGESENDTDTTFVFPITASSVSRPASNHHLELGGGVTISTGDTQDIFDDFEEEDEEFTRVFASGILGYRYQRPDGGFQFRAAFTPIIGGGDFLPWVGVSAGYAW